MNKRLVLIDFDHTLYKGDSFITFFRLLSGNFYFLFISLLLLPYIIFYKFRMIKNRTLKEAYLFFLIKNKTIRQLEKTIRDYMGSLNAGAYHPGVFKKFHMHQADRDTIFIVSASLDIWMKPWAETNNVHCICTVAECINGKYTGKIDGQNCAGAVKKKMIVHELNLSQFDEIIVYGNSPQDEAMLSLASKPEYAIRV